MIAQSVQERRYRRLLRLYPQHYRREYQEEMLAVLLADARPGPAQILDLIRSALAVHGRLFVGDLSGPVWRRAAAVVQFFGAAMLLACAVRRFAVFGSLPVFSAVDVTRVVSWAAVLAAGLLGLRVLGVSAAAVGLAAEIAAPARFYRETPAVVLNAYWALLAAAVVLIAAALSSRAERPRGLVPLAGAAAALIGQGFDRLAWWQFVGSGSSAHHFPGRWHLSTFLPLVAVVLAAIAVTRQEPMIRRRVVAAAVPVVGAFSLSQFAFGDLVAYNGFHPESVRMLGAGQWAALVLIPVSAFLVAAELNRRLEDTRFRAGAAGTSRGA